MMEHKKPKPLNKVMTDFRELVIGSPVPHPVSDDNMDDTDQHFQFSSSPASRTERAGQLLKEATSPLSHGGDRKTIAVESVPSPAFPQIKVDVIKPAQQCLTQETTGIGVDIHKQNEEGAYSRNALTPVHSPRSPVQITAHGNNFIRYYRSPSGNLMKSRSENNMYCNVQSLSPDLDTMYQRESTSNDTLYELRDWKGLISPRTARKSSAQFGSAKKSDEKLTLSHNCLLSSHSPVTSPNIKKRSPKNTTGFSKEVSSGTENHDFGEMHISGKATPKKPKDLKLPSLGQKLK